MTDPDPWPDLVSTALVGTSRRAVPPTPGLPGASGGDPATALLDRAALAAVRRRAGQRPRRIAPPPPAPDETAPLIDGPALVRLQSILAGRHPEVLPEWLDLAAATGRRLPPEVLPALLDRARSNTQVRPVLARLGGARARWLAEHNPAWLFFLESADPEETVFDPEAWKTGTPALRRLHLAALRRTDPAAARDLLAQTWTHERADQRHAFLATLETGLSEEDEPLLATALRDRTHRVRVLAAVLLMRLPGSDTGRRLAEQTARLLRVDDSGGTRRIVVDQPGDVDAEFTSLLDPGTKKKKEKDEQQTPAARVRPLLSQVPPATWIGRLGDTPRQVLDAVADPEVRSILANAAALHGDLDWARALLDSMTPAAFDLPEAECRMAGLLALLPRDEQHAWALRWESGRLHIPHRFGALLDALDFPWNRELSERMADRLLAEDQDPHRLYQVREHASRRLDPGLYERFAAEGAGNRRLTDLVNTLRFRHDMRKELT